MRFLMKVMFDVEKANEMTRDGAMGEKIGKILEHIKPEAAYFVAEEGSRTAYLIINMEDVSELPKIAEPWFLALNGRIDIKPAMVVDDLIKAGEDMKKSVEMFG